MGELAANQKTWTSRGEQSGRMINAGSVVRVLTTGRRHWIYRCRALTKWIVVGQLLSEQASHADDGQATRLNNKQETKFLALRN